MTSSIDIKIYKSKSHTGVDIASYQWYDGFYNGFENTGTYNIIDYQGCAESQICNFTKEALSSLPKKQNIIIGYRTEALNSVYWNIIFYIIQEEGYKNVLWIDGGLTKGDLFRHIGFLDVTHIFSSYFFRTSFREGLGEMPISGIIEDKTKLFVCVSRMARQERLYFTSKILNEKDLCNKGILSCAWGERIKDIFTENEKLNILLGDDKNKFPISLNHEETDRAIHGFYDEFNSAIFHIVQESSVGYDARTHRKTYSELPIDWCIVKSDRLFFTEKTAKPFCCNQIPLFVSAPGYVEILRRLGFDVFDDIVDHSYDKEDNIIKRCDLVFTQLKNISEMRTVEEWINFLRDKNISNRFIKNRERLQQIFKEQDSKSYSWVKENF